MIPGPASDLAQQIAKEIRHELRRREWSQGRLAKELGDNRHNVSRWLSGRQKPSMKTLVRIAEIFGMKVQVRFVVPLED